MRDLIIIPQNLEGFDKEIYHYPFQDPNKRHINFLKEFIEYYGIYQKNEYENLLTDSLAIKLAQDGYLNIHLDELDEHVIFYLPFTLNEHQVKFIKNNFARLIRPGHDIYIKSIINGLGDYNDIEEDDININMRSILNKEIKTKYKNWQVIEKTKNNIK